MIPKGKRSAAGQAAGYHFQIQRALLSILRAPTGFEISIETLDDLTIADTAVRGTTTFEQLKHSVKPGSLSDRSRPLWRALDAWMDLVDEDRLEQVTTLLLVATDVAPDGSAAAHMRGDDRRSILTADQLLLAAATETGAQETAEVRERFAGLDSRDRSQLLAKIEVADGSAGVGDFRTELREAIGLGIPRVGVEDFLDRLVGWWERRAVEMLLGRRRSVTRDEVAEEVARVRDEYTDRTLPAVDQDLATELSEALLAAYKSYPFVRQLELIAVGDARLQLLVADYHRAYTQRARWLEDGILAPEELAEWEERLTDEWSHAFARMRDELGNVPAENEQTRAGKQLYGELEQSDSNPLRDGRDRFLHVGTWHGLADTRRVGWHPDFRARLEKLLGPPVVGATSSGAFDEVAGGDGS